MKVTIKRKLLSFLLALSLVMTFLPQVTLADDIDDYSGEKPNSTYILYRDFTQGVSEDDITAMNNRNQGTADGLVSRRDEVSEGTGSLRFSPKVLTGTYNPSSLIFCEGGLTGSQTETRNAFMPNGDLALKGKFVLEAEMKFDTVEGVTYYPLSIVGSNELTKTGGIIYNYASRMIKIDNGKCYVANQEKCTINTDQYYKFTIVMDIDGDETTRDDPFTAMVSDGENTYIGSGTVYYKTIAGMNDTLKSIGYIHIIKTVAASEGTVVTTDIKNLKFYYAEEPVVTASIEDGETDVQEGSDITLTFNQAMDTTTFSKIVLLDEEENTVTGLTIEPISETTCIITLPKALRSFELYKLVIPDTVLSYQGIGAKAETISFNAAESKYVIPNVTFDIQEDAEDIKEGSTITVSFDQDMKTETFNNIILQDSEGENVTGLTVSIINERSCAVTLPSELESLSAYKLVVPSTVQSLLEVGVSDTSVTFITAKRKIFLNRDFSHGVSEEDITAMQNQSQGTADGLVLRRDEVSDGTDSLKLTMKVLTGTYNPSSFIFCEGGLSSRDTETRRAFMPNGDLALKGKIVLEAEMKFDTVEGVTHYPLSIVSSDELKPTGSLIYNYANRMIKIDNGVCYINNEAKGNINANQYYKFTIVIDIDDDESTTNIPFTATVTDGTTVYTGSGTEFWAVSGKQNLKSIGYIHVIKTIAASEGTVVTTDIKKLKFYYVEAPVVTASIEDGAINIQEGSDITLTFDQVMDTDTFSKIVLLDEEDNTISGLKVESVSETTCVVTLPKALKSFALYKLVIPNTVLTPQGIGAKAKTISFNAAESKYVIPNVTFDIRDGAEGIKEGSTVTLTFDQDMKPETFSNIILQDSEGKAVIGLTVTAINERSCTVTLPSYLKSLSTYRLIVPSTVQSLLEVGVADTTVGFTSAKSDILLNRDFTNGVSEEDIAAMSSSQGTSDGLVAMTSSVIPEAADDSIKLTMKHHTDPSFAPALFYGKGAMKSRKFTESLDLNGIVVLEAEIMFDTVANMEYYPLSIVDGREFSGAYAYNYARNTIKIKDGRCYINNREVCEIQTNKYYTFKLEMQIDGDASTTNDPFTATVSDGINNYTGSGNLYSAEGGDYYTITSIGFVNVLRMVSITDAPEVHAYIKSLKFYNKEVTTVSANVEDGNKNDNVDVNQDIVLTFTKQIKAEELRMIKLRKANDEAVDIVVTPLTDMTNTCTVSVPGGLENNRVYKLSIPALEDELQYKSAAREITFTTKPEDSPALVSAITVNDGGALDLTGGAAVKTSAYVSNQSDKAQNVCLIVCVYNSEDRLKQLSFKNQILEVNATDLKLEAMVTVPADIGEDAYVRVFVVDSFENMNSLCDMNVFE